MEKVFVPKLNDESIRVILEKTPLEKGGCFRVAFDLVVGRRLAAIYVLGFARNIKDNKLTPHAWIRLSNGKYADPLLQHLGLVTTTSYNSIHELKRDDILGLIREKYGKNYDQIMSGKLGVFPPVIDMDGKIVLTGD